MKKYVNSTTTKSGQQIFFEILGDYDYGLLLLRNKATNQVETKKYLVIKVYNSETSTNFTKYVLLFDLNSDDFTMHTVKQLENLYTVVSTTFGRFIQSFTSLLRFNNGGAYEVLLRTPETEAQFGGRGFIDPGDSFQNKEDVIAFRFENGEVVRNGDIVKTFVPTSEVITKMLALGLPNLEPYGINDTVMFVANNGQKKTGKILVYRPDYSKNYCEIAVDNEIVIVHYKKIISKIDQQALAF